MVTRSLIHSTGGGRKNLLAAATEKVDLIREGIDAPFGLCESLRERLAARSLADEVDEVGEPPLLCGQLGLLEFQRVGEVRAELGDFVRDALEDVRDVLGV